MTHPAPSAPVLLSRVYRLLRRHFGYHPGWWPGSPLEITLTAVLVQQCDWAAAWQAVRALGRDGLLSLPALAAARPQDLLPAIRSVAFAPTKSGRLVHLARTLVARGHADIASYLDPAADRRALRHELLELPGIGPETADAILLYAGCFPSFVIDASTRRVFQRLGILPGLSDDFWVGGYHAVQDYLESQVLARPSLYAGLAFEDQGQRETALLRDWHAQLVELAKHHCRKRRPLCHAPGRQGWRDYDPCRDHCPQGECRGCPLAAVCRTSRACGAEGPE